MPWRARPRSTAETEAKSLLGLTASTRASSNFSSTTRLTLPNLCSSRTKYILYLKLPLAFPNPAFTHAIPESLSPLIFAQISRPKWLGSCS